MTGTREKRLGASATVSRLSVRSLAPVAGGHAGSNQAAVDKHRREGCSLLALEAG